MGHIINPVGTHVGVSYSWRFKFLSYRKCDYKYYVDLQHFFNNFFNNFFNEEEFKSVGILYLFIKLLISRGVLNLMVYVQDSFFSYMLRKRWRRIFYRVLKRVFLFVERGEKHYFVRKTRTIISKRFKRRRSVITFGKISYAVRRFYWMFGSVLFNYYVKCFFWFVIKRLALNYLLLFFPQFMRASNFYILVLSNTSNRHLFFNATVIARYFIRKFTQRHKLKNLTRPVIRLLSTSSIVKGFKLSFSGRFSREERATYEWFKRGVVSLNKFTDIVEYDNDFTSLKFGCVCVKVWINYDRKLARILNRKKNFNLATF